MFQFSSTTALHGFAAAALWMTGSEAEADDALERSLDLPEKLKHAPSAAFSLAFTQYSLMYKRDWPRVRATALQLLALSEDEGFQMWIPQAQAFLGLCDAAEGHVEQGLTAALDSFERYAATGTGLTLSQLVPCLGEFLISAGRPGEAVQRLDAMIEIRQSSARGCLHVRALPGAWSSAPCFGRSRYGKCRYRCGSRPIALAGRPDVAAAR